MMNNPETYEECLRDCIERSRFGAIVIPCWLAEEIACWIEQHREDSNKPNEWDTGNPPAVMRGDEK